MADYIVVSAANAQLTRVALGMLGAQYLSQPPYNIPYEYPMQGPTYYIWDPKPSVDGTQVAFGPLDTGIDEGFATWLLGRELELDDNGLDVSVTIPSSAQQLDSEWFAPPESGPGGD